MTISTREWSLEWLLDKTDSFKPAPRVPCTIKNLGDVIEQYEGSDVPLVIEGWHQTSHWPTQIFNMEFCRQYFRNENKKISVRNVHSRSDMSMTFEDFLESSRTASTFVEPEEMQRLYGKDVECPHEWEKWLLSEGVIPTQLLPGGHNDLLAVRPRMNGRPDIETLMCYFGIGDTYTPCHKDLCASSGQNLMCYTEHGSSSFWFMTKGSDCSKVADYFHNNMKHELDHEAHVMTLSDLAKAPFDIYIIEQKLGDLVLVPPRSCHQVVNSGKLTVKMSWSRMTPFGLATAFYHELPLYRRVCRAETYQIKSTIYYVLTDYTRKLKAFISKPWDSTQKERLKERLVQVLRLYDHVLIEEYFSHDNFIEAGKSRSEEGEEELPEQSSGLADHFQMCDFCGADIFHSYFRCSRPSGPESRTIICSGCYAEGRTCTCENMDPKQRQKPSILLSARWEALEALKIAGYSIENFEGSESQKEQRSFFVKAHERSVFQAAMLVHQMRVKNKTRQSRMCRLTDSHPVPSNWALSCKKCHSSKCFSHLLTLFNMHCIPALFSFEEDASHVAYHAKHAAKFPDYRAKERSLLKDQGENPSSAPDFAVQLVHNASKFPVCQPLKGTHTKLGWYDKVPPAPKAKPKERKPQPQLIDSTGPDSDGEVDEPHTPSDPRSPANSSQKSTKNNAYVDIRSKTSAAPSRILSREISISPLTSDSEISDSDDMPLRRYFEKRPKRNLPDEPQAVIDLEPDTTASSANTGGKRRQEFKSLEPSGDGTIFAAVDRIGPPRKKRRQESEPQNREAQSKESSSKPIKDASKMRKDKLDDFAASLGAAINQVAESATQTMKERKHRKGDVEQVKKKQPSGDSTLMQPSVTKTMEKSPLSSSRKKPALANGADLQDTAPSPSDRPILVNIADLQDMITNAAEQVARKIVEGSSSTISLATKTAVTMMTGYAATGKFVQGNTHMQFPSKSHFKEAIVKGAGNSTTKASSSIDQRQPKILTAKSGVHASDNHHHQTRETASDAQSSSTTNFPLQRKRPSTPDLSSRTLPATQKKRRMYEDEI